MKHMHKRLTYANVMSTIAVFLVIGGATAFAALGNNTVGTKQLKKNAVTTAKIKKNAVTGAKVKKGSLKGADLNLSTLGTVPSATNAAHATNADNATTVGGRPVRWLLANPSGSIVAQSGGFSISAHPDDGLYVVNAGSSVVGHAIVVSNGLAEDVQLRGTSIAGPCSAGGEGLNCEALGAGGSNDGNHILVVTTEPESESEEDHSFYLVVY